MPAVYVGGRDPMNRKKRTYGIHFRGVMIKNSREVLCTQARSTVVRVQRVGKSGLVFFAWLKHVWLNSGNFRNGGWPTDSSSAGVIGLGPLLSTLENL